MLYPQYFQNSLGTIHKIESETKATSLHVTERHIDVLHLRQADNIKLLSVGCSPATQTDWIMQVQKYFAQSNDFCNDNLKVTTTREEILNSEPIELAFDLRTDNIEGNQYNEDF